jgi:hypothetical protein
MFNNFLMGYQKIATINVRRDTKKAITMARTPPPIPGPKYKIIIAFVSFNCVLVFKV